MTDRDTTKPTDWWTRLYNPLFPDTAEHAGNQRPDGTGQDESGTERERPGLVPDQARTSELARGTDDRSIPPTSRHTGGAGRLPDWRKGETADLSPSTPDPAGSSGTEPNEVQDETDHDGTGPDRQRVSPPSQQDDVPEDGQEEERTDADEHGGPPQVEDRDPPGPGAPASRITPGQPVTRRRWHPAPDAWPGSGTHHNGLTPRVILFNGTAAAAGHVTGIEPFLGQVLPMAGRNATAVVGLALAMAGATAAWKIAGRPSVAAVLPAPRASRVLLTAGAAWLARTCAPYPVAWLAQHGASWGFGPAPTSLLLTATGLCGGLWWLTVPRTRRWWWPLRWVARIPLASALLATALYAPGTHL